MRDLDRFCGCLLGGAAGDALGYAIEFSDEGEIFAAYGMSGITRYQLTRSPVTGIAAQISDDTQMTLFTAAGLLTRDAEVRAKGTERTYSSWIYQNYLDWLFTQNGRYLPAGKGKSWLMNIKGLYVPRAPGMTCLHALRSGDMGTVEEPINNSKGCGGVMRVAPVGLYFADCENWDAEKVAMLGAEAAAITHSNSLGYIPAAMFSQIIYEIVQNERDVLTAVLCSLETVRKMWKEDSRCQQFIQLMEKAVQLAGSDQEDLSAIHELGEGWVADEALAIAVFCALRHADDFDAALIAAVNHKGDSDSTGAIAGNIMGAHVGLHGIPEKYKENLELREVILEIARDLWQGYPSTEETERVWKEKYVTGTYLPAE